MGGALRKQYMPLDGTPILGRTLSVFVHSGLFDEIVAVVPGNDIDYCRTTLLEPLAMADRIRLVAGGGQRQESVRRGLARCRGGATDVVLIHDGVRPFIDVALLRACLAAAAQHGACIVGYPEADTLKRVNRQGFILDTHPREGLWCVQTPQGFQLGLIRAAHQQAREEGINGTDDAQLVERMGRPVRVIAGSALNIKITRPEDLELAQAILRCGLGG
jgi:2-C-methyl-D-erythritol 4-phosphate cytidylyltransferase